MVRGDRHCIHRPAQALPTAKAPETQNHTTELDRSTTEGAAMLKHAVTTPANPIEMPIGDIRSGMRAMDRRIQVALWALLDAGVPLINHRPGERYARLAEELKRQAYLTREIPKRVTFGRHCRKYPIEVHVAAWRASRAQA